jgi:hypothetical protein
MKPTAGLGAPTAVMHKQSALLTRRLSLLSVLLLLLLLAVMLPVRLQLNAVCLQQ